MAEAVVRWMRASRSPGLNVELRNSVLLSTWLEGGCMYVCKYVVVAVTVAVAVVIVKCTALGFAVCLSTI